MKGQIMAVYWGDTPDDAKEMTLSVDHGDGSYTLVVVPIDRMSMPLPLKEKKTRKVKP